MSLFLVLVAVAIVVVVALFILLLYSGLFYTYSIRGTIPASLPKRNAYKVFKGPYWKSGKAAEALTALAPHRRTFSVFYDDPNTVSYYSIYGYKPTQLRVSVCCTTGSFRPDSLYSGLLSTRGGG